MRVLDGWLRQAAASTAVVAIGAVLAGCGTSTPTGPTAIDPSTVPRDVSSAATLTTSNASRPSPEGSANTQTTVAWSCFAATSGAFDAASNCPTQRGSQGHSTQSVAVSPVITAAPTSLQFYLQGNTVVLSWTPPPAPNTPTSYVIEAGTTSGATNIAVFDTGSTGTILTVSGVPPGTYFVRVRARDASGGGPASNEVTVIIPEPPAAPSPCTFAQRAPRNLVGIPVGMSVLLDWAGPHPSCPDADRYIIQAGSAPGASNLAQVATLINVSNFGVPVVSPGTYYVRVLAQFGALVGPPSNEVAVTVTGVDPPGTTRWAGLVANGEGVSTSGDPDCGTVRADLSLTIVPSGGSFFAISTFALRSTSTCPELVGFTDIAPVVGTVTGSFSGGAGSFSVVGRDGTTVTGTFASGRMTGTVTILEDGVPIVGSFVARQQ